MTTSFPTSIREQLLAVAHAERRRRRRTRVAAALAGVVAAISGGFVALGSSPAAADVEVTVREGIVTVRLTDLDANPREIGRALRAHHIEAEVREVPTGPSQVGRFLSVGVDPGASRIVNETGGGRESSSFTIAEGWDGELTIAIGRRAAPGERYGAGTSAFAEHEPLHCAGVQGRRLAEVEARLRGDGRSVEVVVDADGPRRLPLAEAVQDEPDLVVTAASMFSANEVLATVAAVPPFAEPGC